MGEVLGSAPNTASSSSSSSSSQVINTKQTLELPKPRLGDYFQPG
jgi:hypothetical protein